MAKKVRITLVRSFIGQKPVHRRTIRALGLQKIHQSVEHPQTDSIMGMVRSVSHLVRFEEIA
jgi:large subunit ribosomal protein L30